MRDHQRLVVVEHETAVGIARIARRPAEVGVGDLVGIGEFVCGVRGLVPERVLLVGPSSDGQRHDGEHGAQPGGGRPQTCGGLGVAVSYRVRLVERLDMPDDRAAGQWVGLVVTGHQHGGVGRRGEFEAEVAVGVDIEIAVTDYRNDPVRPRAGRRLVVGGHREVHAVTPIAADAVAPLRIDRAHEVISVGIVAAPSTVATERRVHRDELRPAGLGEQVGVEGHAQCGGEHAVAVGDVPVVGDRAVALEEGAVEGAEGWRAAPATRPSIRASCADSLQEQRGGAIDPAHRRVRCRG